MATMANQSKSEQLKTQPAANRGERLYPKRWHRLHWNLTSLRRLLENTAQQHVSKGQGELIDYGCGNMPYRPVLQPLVDRDLGFNLLAFRP